MPYSCWSRVKWGGSTHLQSSLSPNLGDMVVDANHACRSQQLLFNVITRACLEPEPWAGASS